MPTNQHRDAEGARACLVSDRDRQAGFSVAKSISPCWLVNVAFLSLPLVHAEDAMITGVIQLDFAVASIDR